MKPEELVQLLELIMKSNGWGVTVMAQKLGIPRNTIGDWMRKNSIPSSESIKKAIDGIVKLESGAAIIALVSHEGSKQPSLIQRIPAADNQISEERAGLDFIVSNFLPGFLSFVNPFFRKLILMEDNSLRKKLRQLSAWKNFVLYVRALIGEDMRNSVMKEKSDFFNAKKEIKND